MTTWRVSLVRNPSIFVDVEGYQYAYQAHAAARPLLEQRVLELETAAGRVATRAPIAFVDCNFRQLSGPNAGGGLKSRRIA